MPNIDVTDPGVVNVEAQAYPMPPGGSQALPIPSQVFVARLVQVQLPLASGAASVDPPDTDVATQIITRLPVSEFLVTEGGVIQTNNTVSDLRSFIVSSVTTLNAGLPTERYQIFLGTANLAEIGLTLTDIEALFPQQAPAAAPENIPARDIAAWSIDWIIVPRFNTFGVSMAAPVAGNTVQIAVLRDGDEVFIDRFATEIDVTLNPPPQTPVTVSAPLLTPLGNISASTGVVVPFIGSGVRVPFLLGTFEVIDQRPIGTGLPRNVFVG